MEKDWQLVMLAMSAVIKENKEQIKKLENKIEKLEKNTFELSRNGK